LAGSVGEGEKGSENALHLWSRQNSCKLLAHAETDIGRYVQADKIDDSVKFRLLTEPYVAQENYNFKAYLPDKKRAFEILFATS